MKFEFIYIMIFITFMTSSIFLSCNIGLEKNELRVILGGNPDTLDPHRTRATLTSQINNNIYESLFYSDGSALLVEDYKITNNRKTWTILLKKGILFHHQKELQAEDVIASFSRLQEKDGKYPSPVAEQYAVIQSITAKDLYTVVIELQYAYNGFKALLSSPESVILPADLIQQHTHNFNLNPVGTGAFAFQEWQQNKVIRLKKNENYRQPVYLEKIAFIIINDRSSQLQALYKKEVDIVPYLGKIESEQIEIDNDLKVVSKPGSTILVLAMNLRNPSLSVLETRKAIAKAIDKEKIINLAYNGGRKLNVFWHRESDIFIDIFSIYDVNTAKDYFKENPIYNTLTISVPNAFSPHVRAAEMYQEMLSKVGISTVIEELEWGIWLNRVYRQGIFDLTVIGHTGKLDPYLRLSSFGKGNSYIGWKNNNFVSLVDRASATNDITLKTKLYQSALQIMTQEQPFVFIGENEVKFGVTNRVGNFEFDKILEYYDFRKTQLF